MKIPNSLKILILRKPNNKYLGICLELNILEEGNDPFNLAILIAKMSFAHIKTVVDNKLSSNLLERKADEKYWDLWEISQKPKRDSRIVNTMEYSTAPSVFNSITNGFKELAVC